MHTAKQYLYKLFFFVFIFFFFSNSGISQENHNISPFPYDSSLNKFTYRGPYTAEGLNSDQLFELTFFCYDSLHFMKTKKLDKTGLSAEPLDEYDNYGKRKSKSQHWFKDNFNFSVSHNADSALIIDATYMTIDNAVMYQYRDFRLDTNFNDQKYNDAIPFEKAIKDGFPIESFSWIDERIKERMEGIKQCVLRNKDNWEGIEERRKKPKLEGK
jgi:hypothetical protein